MTGKNKNIGLRDDAAPEVKYSSVIPPIAMTIATGSSLPTRFDGGSFGTSGGRSMTISPSSYGGGHRRLGRKGFIDQWTLRVSVWFHSI
jgi:hypothetical protein